MSATNLTAEARAKGKATKRMLRICGSYLSNCQTGGLTAKRQAKLDRINAILKKGTTPRSVGVFGQIAVDENGEKCIKGAGTDELVPCPTGVFQGAEDGFIEDGSGKSRSIPGWIQPSVAALEEGETYPLVDMKQDEGTRVRITSETREVNLNMNERLRLIGDRNALLEKQGGGAKRHETRAEAIPMLREYAAHHGVSASDLVKCGMPVEDGVEAGILTSDEAAALLQAG